MSRAIIIANAWCSATLLAVALLLTSCTNARAQVVRVGSKAFTEGVVLGDVLARTAERAGAVVEHRRSLGGTQILWKALVRGEIDAYVEYTGTITEEILAGAGATGPADVRAALAREGIRMSAPLGFNNTYAIGMLESRARALGVRAIGDLARHPELRLGLSNEFLDRRDGWPGLSAAYGLGSMSVRGLDHDLAYRAIAAGEIDVVDLYSTDAEIAYYGLRVLADTVGYFPRYEAVILYRAALDSIAPAAVTALLSLEGSIDERAMIAMNADAKLRKVPESDVAARFVDSLHASTPSASRRDDSASASTSPRPGRTDTASQIAERTVEHLGLVGISLFAAILVGVPLGVLSSRVRWLGQLVLATTSVIYTIPSLALLVVMIPLFGIGALPVLIALFLYSLLPIVRNTFVGLGGIAAPLVESAIALGLSPRARLRRVELPLALPTILAGIKTAAVMNVATATIGALIGAGGYGQPILTGIRLDDMGLILQGAIPAAIMALAVQGLFELLEHLVVPRGMRVSPPAARRS